MKIIKVLVLILLVKIYYFIINLYEKFGTLGIIILVVSVVVILKILTKILNYSKLKEKEKYQLILNMI